METGEEREKRQKAEVEHQVLSEIARITSASPESITEPDAEFLRARRSYLTTEQATKFAGVLKVDKVDSSASADEDTKPAKKPGK